ncbi:MAG: hypothetical protein JNK58_04565 [Phycisphaerae bacterium]|nr:hypothetical protein [Phycisphaerae bacterium]
MGPHAEDLIHLSSTRNMNRRILTLVPLALALALGGCAFTRHDQLRQQSTRVETRLKKEQSRVLSLAREDAERAARLDHLTELRWTLSAANIGLAAVPRLVPIDKRDLAYDVLEETYDTIDWNIPLGPADHARPLPARFNAGTLNLD